MKREFLALLLETMAIGVRSASLLAPFLMALKVFQLDVRRHEAQINRGLPRSLMPSRLQTEGVLEWPVCGP